MRYTSKGKLNYNKMQYNIKRNGFSDKAKKVIGQVLLAMQIIGTTPTITNIEYVSENDLEFNSPKFEEFINKNKEKIKEKINEQVIVDFGNKKEIDRSNIAEFAALNYETMNREFNKAIQDDTFSVTRYFLMSKQELKEAEEEGIKYYIIEQDRYQNIEPILCMYTPKQLIEIQEYYEKTYGEIANNSNLTQKEKMIAFEMKLKTQVTYDNGAINEETEYGKNAEVTSRNQYGFINYGTGICMSYSESVEIFGEMINVEVKRVSGLTEDGFHKLSDEEKQDTLNAMSNGKPLPKSDHQVNIVSFDDGSSYMLDITNSDGIQEVEYKGINTRI